MADEGPVANEQSPADRGWLPRLHLIAGDDLVEADDFRGRLRPVLDVGGPELALHLRARRATTRRLCRVAEWLAKVAEEIGTLTVVNDRLDVALATGAAAVHLKEESLPVEVVGEIIGRIGGGTLRIGRSIHAVDQADGWGSARSAGRRIPDYLVFGAIFPTRSHPGRPAVGLDALEVAAARSSAPLLAIGGISPARVEAVRDRGAHGVVVLSGVWGDAAPVQAAKRYLEALR